MTQGWNQLAMKVQLTATLFGAALWAAQNPDGSDERREKAAALPAAAMEHRDALRALRDAADDEIEAVMEALPTPEPLPEKVAGYVSETWRQGI